MTITTDLLEAITGDACFPALKDYIISSTGLVFYTDRSDTLATHIADRLKMRGISDCRAYLNLLQDDRDGDVELDQLIELLTIGETHFFRHREMFDALRDVVLPEILNRNQSTRRLRIWSAGCSIGAETYSVSILLRRELQHLLPGWTVSIVATDINRQFLAQAAQGRYEEWAFRGTPHELRRECFERQGNGWQIAPRFKEGVSFQYHNLARHPFPSPAYNLFDFDLILCRNVLIYFGPGIIQRFATQMADCLVEGGWLAMGHAEYTHQFDQHFESVAFPGASLYRRPTSGKTRAGFRSSTGGIDKTRMTAKPTAICADLSGPWREEQIRFPRASAPAIEQPKLRSSAAVGSSAPWQTSEIARMQTLADQGDVDAALELCEALIAKDRLNPVYHFYQGLLLNQAAGHDAGIQALQRAIYLDRTFVLAHYHLGLTRQKQANACEALKAYRNVLRLLAGCDQKESLPNAEGLTIGELHELTCMQMEALENL